MGAIGSIWVNPELKRPKREFRRRGLISVSISERGNAPEGNEAHLWGIHSKFGQLVMLPLSRNRHANDPLRRNSL